jgi:hypothetical protein
MDFESATERMMAKMGDAANAWEVRQDLSAQKLSVASPC